MDVPVADKINIEQFEESIDTVVRPQGAPEDEEEYEYVDSWPDEGGW